jgi:hypothetical protein
VILADTWGTVGGIASVVAAGAALVTIHFARATVREAHQARQDASAAHKELVDLQNEELQSSRKAFVEEVAARERATDAQIRVQRMTQVERIGDILGRVVELAREEAPIFGDGPPRIIPDHFRTLPAVLTQLGAALTVLEQLGGPELTSARQLSADGAGEPSPRVLGGAVSAMQQLETFIQNRDEFKLPGRQ